VIVNPPPRRRRPQHSDDKLLGAATRVFAREGYGRATVDAVAAEAGSTKPTLYARFGSKAELYRAAVEREMQVFTEQLFSAYVEARDEPVRVLIDRAVHAWFDYADQHPDGFRLLLAPTDADPASGLFEQMRDRVTDRVTELITGALARIDVDDAPGAGLAAAMIVGACVDGARRLHADPALTTARASALAVAFVVGATAGMNPGLLNA
jgi:AcrR family transcriptional regulator